MYPDSKFLIFRGLSVHYRIALPRGDVRHRVLLVPSPGQSTYNWRHVVPELLVAGCMCVLCDLPGFGYSACGSGVPHDQETRAKLLWGVLDEVDMEYGKTLSTWNLMGHGSAAGTVATMALMQPDSVNSIAMINPILYSLVGSPIKRLIASPLGEKIIRGWYRRNMQNRRRFRKIVRRIYGCDMPGQVIETLRRPFMRLGSEESLQKLLIEGYDIRTDQLNKLFMPAMILWGGQDCLLGGTIPDRLRRRDYPNAEYHVIRRAGHCAMETHSPAVCDYLRGWIREMW